ncbi:MAG TPA: NAD(P)-binding domain-containing protein [Polyangiaceae bacterium]
MKIGVLGTGMVGNVIASKLVALGHEVRMGSRSKGNEKALAWVKEAGSLASEGSFADAAAFGELAFLCTSGAGSLAAVESAKAGLSDKILIDISNPLDFSKGFPPTLFVSNQDSLGEQIQRALPSTRVVKTLNTVNCQVMVDAARVAGGDHDMFVCGNDAAAKGRVTEILRGFFGWRNVLDLGDISCARATEAYLHLWLRLYGSLKTGDFNVRVVR